jgi:hypothetical protein
MILLYDFIVCFTVLFYVILCYFYDEKCCVGGEHYNWGVFEETVTTIPLQGPREEAYCWKIPPRITSVSNTIPCLYSYLFMRRRKEIGEGGKKRKGEKVIREEEG